MRAAATGLGLQPAFQPIVSLPEGAIVGFEALARWPSQHDLNPMEVFAYATAAGTLDRLDQLCIDAAITAALTAQMTSSTLLAINAEPISVYVPRTLDAVLARGHDELTLMFELTERGLLAHPHALLAKVTALRADGFAIALDDVGAHPDSLALLDVISPDVIKLDLQLVQSRPRREQARTLAAVLAHHERTGAVILAEGIENDEHLEQALALGASLGQGYKFGRPGPLSAQTPVPWSLPSRTPRPRPASGSPSDLLASDTPLRTARKETLTAFSRHIESQALNTVDPPMVLTALQQAQYFTTATRARYLDLARSSPLVAIFGQHLPSDLGGGPRHSRRGVRTHRPTLHRMDRPSPRRPHRRRAHRPRMHRPPQSRPPRQRPTLRLHHHLRPVPRHRRRAQPPGPHPLTRQPIKGGLETSWRFLGCWMPRSDLPSTI